jgi:hypothetical protein
MSFSNHFFCHVPQKCLKNSKNYIRKLGSYKARKLGSIELPSFIAPLPYPL